jgi:Siphovirus ReqiPepy6 Gp37-like protein
MSIECWVTGPDGTGAIWLDRSQASPFRRFAVSRMRGADPGLGALEYHQDNALVAATPTLFADGNLVWMRYRGHTLAWIIEERKAVLDETEHATDWVAVSGRGVKQLVGDRIVWPSAFSESALDPSAWGPDAQWYRVVNRACGEMLWDMIDASNPRFATQLVRGTIETSGSDGWTQDFRFDGLLDVVGSVTAAYGDVDMDGLTFSYRNDPGDDLSASVIFEEGADILKVERQTSDRDTLSWIVAEGVGEGVIAKLATATDATIGRRREGYLDAKDAGNLPLVQLRANAALDENKPVDSIALEVTEERFAAFTDFDIWDTVRIIAPSRGIDELGVIVAMYVVEGDDERIRVGFDVNSPRQEYLLKLEAGNRSTAHSVGVGKRYPQGQLVPYSFSGSGVLDSGSPLRVFVKIPERVTLIIEALVTVSFRQFFASAKDAASGGGSTSGSSSASSSGASSASSADVDDGQWFTHETAAHTHTDPQGGDTGSAGSAVGYVKYISEHTHGIAHTHGIPHTHGIDPHSHGLTYGTWEEAMPSSHNVTMTAWERSGGSWVLRGTFTGLTSDLEDIIATAVMVNPGDWRLDFLSIGGQPNGGRLGADVYGAVTGAIQSA